MQDDDLSSEWRALQARDYAEEGIPVIVGIETVGVSTPRKGEPKLAAAFRAMAAAFGDVERPGPHAILGILAAREMRRLE